MKLLTNTLDGLKYKQWSRREALTYFIKGVARELRIFPSFFAGIHEKQTSIRDQKEFEQTFLKNWLKLDCEQPHFDFHGIKLPDISSSPEKLSTLLCLFDDVLMFPCLLNDNYNKALVEYFDHRIVYEGPYGYQDNDFDVVVKKGDVVIDAGAWIGDFCAYAAYKGAVSYAFEPVAETFEWLCKTAELNRPFIYPIKKGLGNKECELNIMIDKKNSGASSTISKGKSTEKIQITTLDQFVAKNKLEKVDFIKADIEGAERDLLRGATNVLKTFAPKLAICTYHLPDDPQVLEEIILKANPNYKVVHTKHKLMAAVVNKQ